VLRLAIRLRSELASQPGARVLCTNWFPCGLAAWLLRKLTGASFPYYIAVHGAELNSRGRAAGRLKNLLCRLVMRDASGIFPVSRYTADKLARKAGPGLPMRVLSNGVNPSRFFPILCNQRRSPVILSVCRLSEHKGIDTALKAFAILHERGIEFEYRIAGHGPDRKRLEKIASELGLSAKVRFLGEVADLNSLYNGCDLFLLLSREVGGAVEGFGLVFLEAAACGKASVGTRSGGIPDAVLDGETGLLVAENDARAAADAIQKLLTDKALRERLAGRAQLRAREELSWRAVAGRMSMEMEKLDA